MLVRSCFLITLIKCLTGLLDGSFMSKSKIGRLFAPKVRTFTKDSGSGCSESVTRSPIELSGTAKNKSLARESLEGTSRKPHFQRTLHHMTLPLFMSMHFLYNCKLLFEILLPLYLLHFQLLHELDALYVWHGQKITLLCLLYLSVDIAGSGEPLYGTL